MRKKHIGEFLRDLQTGSTSCSACQKYSVCSLFSSTAADISA